MQNEDHKVSRRKMLGWLSVVSVVTMAGAALNPWKKAKAAKTSGTVKMLTQDGKLVEVDARLLASGTQKISDKELQGWIKTK